MYSAATVANAFIRIAKKNGLALSNLKLQKLVYFAHGWCLAILGKPLIKECVEAWQYGPVVPDLYHALKRYGSSVVTEEIPDVPEIPENSGAYPFLKAVFNKYGMYTPAQLVAITHQPGAPWQNVCPRSVIPDDSIAEYFKHLPEKLKGSANAGKQ